MNKHCDECARTNQQAKENTQNIFWWGQNIVRGHFVVYPEGCYNSFIMIYDVSNRHTLGFRMHYVYETLKMG